MATVRLASEGEMPLAISSPVGAVGEIPTRAVGKGQSDHHGSLLLLTPYAINAGKHDSSAEPVAMGGENAR